MSWLYILMTGLICVISKLLFVKWYNPSTIFSGYWFIIMFLAKIELYGLYEVEEYIFFYIMCACLAFFWGVLTIKFIKVKSFEISEQHFFMKYILFGALLISFLYIQNRVRMLLMGVSLSSMRYNSDTLSVLSTQSSYWLSVLYNYFAMPCLTAIMLILCVEYIQKKSFKKLVIPFLLDIMLIIGDGGRTTTTYLIIFLIFAVLTIKDSGLKIKKKYYFAVLVPILLFVVILKERGTIDIFKSTYYYLCGCLKLLESTFDNRNLYDIHTYGATSFMGFYRFLNSTLEMFGRGASDLFNEANNFIWSLQYSVIPVGEGEYENFFMTCFAYFIKDFGLAGLFVCPFVYGAFMSVIYKKFVKTFNQKYLVLYIYLVAGVCMSMMHFQFANVQNAFTGVWICLLLRKVRD